jgi:hypothetical protein
MVLTTGHSRKKAQSCSRRSEEATKNYRMIKQIQSGQKSRPETTPGSKMNMVLTTGHSRKKAQSCSRRSEEATKNYCIIKQSQSGQKSRPETTPGSKMHNGINHGTQPQKGTILLPTERRSDQKLSHDKAKPVTAKNLTGDNTRQQNEQWY